MRTAYGVKNGLRGQILPFAHSANAGRAKQGARSDPVGLARNPLSFRDLLTPHVLFNTQLNTRAR